MPNRQGCDENFKMLSVFERECFDDKLKKKKVYNCDNSKYSYQNVYIFFSVTGVYF